MTPRTDSPLLDIATGAWFYVMALSVLGYWLTIAEGRAWTRI
jgi:hypothetical protein